MYPKIGPFASYGLFYSLGILSHCLLAFFIARRLKLKHRLWIAVTICYCFGMVIGAKALYDIAKSQFSFRDMVSAEHYIHGGLWGGLLAYFALAVPVAIFLSNSDSFCRRRPRSRDTRMPLAELCSEPTRKALDLIALTVPLPWMFAKVGCFFNGCCYGKPTSLPWAVTYPDNARFPTPGVPLHPTQLYEILLMIAIAAVFLKLNYNRWQGAFLLWFLTLYGFGRTALDFLRGDQHPAPRLNHLPLNLTQLFCLLTAAAALISLFLYHRRSYRRTDS